MHKSRLGTIVVDCRTDDVESAATFWSAALGRSVPAPDPDNPTYRELDGPDDEIKVLVQAVEHPSRVHIDIETDNIEAEAARLERLGAKRIKAIRDWVVMEAPTGQRFCIVPAFRENFLKEANIWEVPHA